MSQELANKENQNLTLVEKLKLKRNQVALVLDCSGSMQTDCEPGISKIQALRKIVQSTTSTNCFYFNSQYGPCTRDTIPSPIGGTFLGGLLKYLKNVGQKDILILTDGDIQDKDLTLLNAKGMNIKIMYIGAGERPKFLDTLANASGGYATTEDLKETKSLSEKLQLLLTSGEQKPRGAFEL